MKKRIIIYIDFTKAFDKVPTIILSKLKTQGTDEKLETIEVDQSMPW